MKKIRYFSAFSGIGAPERAMQLIPELESECVGYSEIDKYAIQIYEKHFPSHKNYGNITSIDPLSIPDFDFFVGGFPCQAFSIAGRRGGFEDTRGTLFFEIVRILRLKKPAVILLENVKGLLSHKGGATYLTIKNSLEELGYIVQRQTLNSRYWTSQNRPRVFLVGHLREIPQSEILPLKPKFDLPSSNGANEATEATSALKANQGGPGIDNTFVYTPALRATDSKSGDNQTIVIESEGVELVTDYLPGKTNVRWLTPIECERLQGFPDDWTGGISDTQRRKTIGNSMTVNVMKDVIASILKV